MEELPLGALFGVLIVLLLLSAFFSGSETSFMALSRYRLRHLARARHAGAVRAAGLLERPERLMGLILLGNNFVKILASAIATVIALRLGGGGTIAAATFILTFVVLIFSEVVPKTLGGLHPERVALPAAFIHRHLLRLLYPLVWLIDTLANRLLRLFGVDPAGAGAPDLSSEELRTVVNEAGARISHRHQRMLLSILDLETVKVEDIMVPRNEIVGIDIEDDWGTIQELLMNCQFTKIPVYRNSIDNVIGILYLRTVLPLMRHGRIAPEDLVGILREPYFVPEGTPLNTQLINFQRIKRRIGLVVDEYGEIMGLVTLEDILEEIVGEFTTAPSDFSRDIHPQEDGSYLVDGGIHIRDLNRVLHWELPTSGPKTLNGLILEHMETIPEAGTSMLLSGYPVEIVQTKDNAVKTIRIRARLPRRDRGEAPER